MDKTMHTERQAEFSVGDEVMLARGTYQGTLGVFLRLRADVRWADITERNGTVRCHPLEWLIPAPAMTPVTKGN